MQVYPTLKKGELPLIKLILFGLGGSGKTTLAYSFHNEPLTGPAIVLNYGGNPDKLMLKENHPFVLDCDKLEDVDVVYQFLAGGQSPKDKFRELVGLPPDIVFKTFIFDTVSDWQRMKIEGIVGPDRADIISQSKAPEATKHGASIQAATLRLVREIINLKLNVVLTLQQQTVVNFATGEVSNRPFLYGNSRDYVTAWAKLVGRMERGKNGLPVVFWEEAVSTSVTKNQLADTLGNGMGSPTAKAIIQKLKEFYF
jgi:hypothetical protein